MEVSLPVEKGFVIQRSSTGNAELDSVLSGGFPKGSLILVSGNPGTGKTIFTSTFLYEGAAHQDEPGIYVSFSESKRSFFDNMMTLGLDFERLEKEGRFKFLEMFTATKEGMGRTTVDILETVKKLGAKRLVIDSYSVMAQAMGSEYEGRQVLHTVLSKIVRNMGCTTLVIGEQPTGESRIGEGAEEFVADGVLNLKLTIPRELEIRKMRGTRLKTRNVIYTIDNGFRVLITEIGMPPRMKKWNPVPDSGDLISTGSRDVDAILGGGFPRGAYVVLESSIEVMVKEMRLFTRALALNFINQKRGVVLIPTSGINAGEIRKSFLPYTTKELFDNYTRISEQREKTDADTGPLPPYVIPSAYGEGAGEVSQLEDSSRIFYAAYKELKTRTGNQPILRSIGYDSLESSYARFPERLFNEVGLAIARTRAAGDLTLGIAKPSFNMLGKVLTMVDWHIKLTKKDGLLMLQGIKPYTNLYGVGCDVSLGYPVVKLTLLT